MTAGNAEPVADFASAADLPSLYAMLDRVQAKNGWAKAVPVIVSEPRETFVPHRWRYADMRAALQAAGRLVDAAQAERRNLIMANPIPGNDYATVATLVGAYQMVKAGESARSHRHTPNAMRVVLEAETGMSTVVDGVKLPMEPGDVLLTPNWCWHGHANEGRRDAYWIDFLDAPLTAAIGPMFFQQHPQGVQAATVLDPRSPMRFACADYVRALQGAPEVAPGVRRLMLGAGRIATFDQGVIELRAGSRWGPERCTANQVYAVVRGSGRSRIGGRDFDWSAGDMMAAPAWQDQRHAADADALLVRVSDEPLLRMLGWYRTAAGMAAAKAQG